MLVPELLILIFSPRNRRRDLMALLKLYFGIEDENKNVIVEKSEQWLQFSDDAVAKARAVADLEKKFAEVSQIDLKVRTPTTDQEQRAYLDAFEALKNARKEVYNILDASGVAVGRYCRNLVIAHLARMPEKEKV